MNDLPTRRRSAPTRLPNGALKQPIRAKNLLPWCYPAPIPACRWRSCLIGASGTLFVVRDAGNIATTTDIGSIEYAVDHLGTPLVVVLGHSKCGAVTAAVQGGEAPPNIKAIVDFIAPAVTTAKDANPDKTGEALVPAAITANVWQATADIFKNSPMIREKVKDGKLKLVGATYDIKSGKVNWLGPHPQQTQLVAGEAK